MIRLDKMLLTPCQLHPDVCVTSNSANRMLAGGPHIPLMTRCAHPHAPWPMAHTPVCPMRAREMYLPQVVVSEAGQDSFHGIRVDARAK